MKVKKVSIEKTIDYINENFKDLLIRMIQDSKYYKNDRVLLVDCSHTLKVRLKIKIKTE